MKKEWTLGRHEPMLVELEIAKAMQDKKLPAAVWTLQKLDSKDWRSENLLSLAGVYKPRAKIEESSLPAALVRYLSEHPHIRRVVLRLDNDATGRIAAETIKTLLPRKYAVTVDIQPPPQGKDYNDCLCMRLGLPITKRRERSKER